jgi:hypothetical protein
VQDAKEEGFEWMAVKVPEAKKGFVLLPRCWVVVRSFASTARFLCLARGLERTAETLRSLYSFFVVRSNNQDARA